METQVTVVRPVETEVCRKCRFALVVAAEEDPDCTVVLCLRKDCDNTHPERLRPLLLDLVGEASEPLRMDEILAPLSASSGHSRRRSRWPPVFSWLEKWLMR